MAEPRVSVVIINFNSGKYIFKCLEHVRAQTHRNLETLVVDNASSDGSSERLAAMAAAGEIRYHRLETNGGSSKANNFGIRNTDGEFVLILNADAFLGPDYVFRCLAAFSADPEIGTVVGKLVSSHDNTIIDCAGITLFREGMTIDRGMREKDVGQYAKPELVAGACCAAALYRRRMLEAVRLDDEYYDEDFFAFREDVDLSVRSTLLGWKTLYIPDAVAQHVRGGTNERGSEFVEFLGLRNLHFYYIKTFDRADRVGAFLRHLLYFFWRFGPTGAMERKFRDRIHREVEQARDRLLAKRRRIEAVGDYQRLRPYVTDSYLRYTMAVRLKRLVSGGSC